MRSASAWDVDFRSQVRCVTGEERGQMAEIARLNSRPEAHLRVNRCAAALITALEHKAGRDRAATPILCEVCQGLLGCDRGVKGVEEEADAGGMGYLMPIELLRHPLLVPAQRAKARLREGARAGFEPRPCPNAASDRVRHVAPAAVRIAASFRGLERLPQLFEVLGGHIEGLTDPRERCSMDGEGSTEIGHGRERRRAAGIFASPFTRRLARRPV